MRNLYIVFFKNKTKQPSPPLPHTFSVDHYPDKKEAFSKEKTILFKEIPFSRKKEEEIIIYSLDFGLTNFVRLLRRS